MGKTLKKWLTSSAAAAVYRVGRIKSPGPDKRKERNKRKKRVENMTIQTFDDVVVLQPMRESNQIYATGEFISREGACVYTRHRTTAANSNNWWRTCQIGDFFFLWRGSPTTQWGGIECSLQSGRVTNTFGVIIHPYTYWITFSLLVVWTAISSRHTKKSNSERRRREKLIETASRRPTSQRRRRKTSFAVAKHAAGPAPPPREEKTRS